MKNNKKTKDIKIFNKIFKSKKIILSKFNKTINRKIIL
jgi:hypothetical protein